MICRSRRKQGVSRADNNAMPRLCILHSLDDGGTSQRKASKTRGNLVRKPCSVTCPHCGRAAEFHSHRWHTSLSLVGPVRYRRAYYLCRVCGKGLFPFDRDAGMTARDLTPALERVATLAGAVADSFEKGAELLDEMAG